MLNIPALWDNDLTGQGQRVGHLDTGVAAHLPALSGRVAAFRQFDRNGWHSTEVEPEDSADHGTHTAAILCGGLVQGLPVGVAPGAQLVSGMVIEGGYSLLRVLMGLAWISTKGVRVVCLSLGARGHNPIFHSLISYLRQQGILVISPVGNAAAGQSFAPGNYSNVLSVGAVDAAGRVAPFSGSLNSHYGRICHKPNLLAPGVEVATLSPRGELVRVSGTSMAAAYVAGVALLLFQSKPQASVQQVEHALLQTARPLPAEQTHRSRAGLIDPLAAVAVLHGSNKEIPISRERAEGKFIDPRLLFILQYATDHALVVALIVAVPGACLEAILAEVSNHSDHRPKHFHKFPDACTASLIAPKPFVEYLIDHEKILVVSAPDIDLV